MWRAKMMGVIASVITPGRHNIRKKALHCVFIHNLDCRLMLNTLLLDAGIEMSAMHGDFYNYILAGCRSVTKGQTIHCSDPEAVTF